MLQISHGRRHIMLMWACGLSYIAIARLLTPIVTGGHQVAAASCRLLSAHGALVSTPLSFCCLFLHTRLTQDIDYDPVLSPLSGKDVSCYMPAAWAASAAKHPNTTHRTCPPCECVQVQPTTGLHPTTATSCNNSATPGHVLRHKCTLSGLSQPTLVH
jgi:hypothetical protein